jgi:methylase of polypeptide subunit release factors
VIDIGCAEGYYAVGLALRIPSAYVIAFDTNREATDLCRLMADLKRLSHRLITAGWCDEHVLALLTSGGRSLIVCDTEGYEKHFFRNL